MHPPHSSRLRAFCSRWYHTARRQADWHFSGKRFALRREPEGFCSEILFHHETPLIRELPRVDMWLQYNKVTNLRLAAARVNGVVVYPGEVFSLWRLVGKPSRAKGYLKGMVLENGRVKPGVGGGLCQLSNLIFWMTLHTPLTVIERWRHTHDVFPDVNRTVPFGSGATCSYPSLDLQIANNTPEPVQLILKVTSTHLEGEWRSFHFAPCRYEVYEAFHEITRGPRGGYLRHNILRRRTWDPDGTVIADEFITENHALMMYQPLLPEPAADGSAANRGGNR